MKNLVEGFFSSGRNLPRISIVIKTGIREIKEETNLEICNFRLVYIRELNIKDKGRGIEFYFYIDSYKGEPKKGFDPELKEASFEELCLIDIDKLKEIEGLDEEKAKQIIEILENQFEEEE